MASAAHDIDPAKAGLLQRLQQLPDAVFLKGALLSLPADTMKAILRAPEPAFGTLVG